MPGPSNNKKKAKGRAKNAKKQNETLPPPQNASTTTIDEDLPERGRTRYRGRAIRHVPSTPEWDPALKPCPKLDEDVPEAVEKVMFQPPFIHDPGNGPRVRDAKAFMGSFFAQPPALEVSKQKRE